MSGIAGILNISDSERAYIQNIGQQLVFDAVNQLFGDYNAEVNAQLSVFVERKTEKFAMRYLLPGGGKLQVMGQQAPAGAVKRYGSYDVGFPLRQYGAELAGDRVDMGYMTVAELDAQLRTIMIQDLNTMRFRILTSIFEDTNLTFTDPVNGSVTVRRLANTDGTSYPPVVGTETESDDDHYLNAGYAVSAISATNNPVVTLRNEVAEHFGGIGSAGRNFVLFHANDSLSYLTAISGYTAISDQFIQAASTTAIPVNWPNVPGRVHGRMNGVWLSEWDGWIPDTYAILVLLEAPAPLMMRTDPSETGLGNGDLELVATDKEHPMQRSSYERRFGLGCGNRLSAAVMLIDDSGSYSPPSAYAE